MKQKDLRTVVALLESGSWFSVCKRYGPQGFVDRDHISEGVSQGLDWTLDG